MRPIALLTAAALACAGCDFHSTSTTSAPEELSRVAAAPSAPAFVPESAAPELPERVVIPPPQSLTDAAITSRIRTEIGADPGMAGADVSVNTDKGVVVLSGVVKSQEQTGIASAHAQSQDGVLRVDNQLRATLS